MEAEKKNYDEEWDGWMDKTEKGESFLYISAEWNYYFYRKRSYKRMCK